MAERRETLEAAILEPVGSRAGDFSPQETEESRRDAGEGCGGDFGAVSHVKVLERLVAVIQELSLARSLEGIMVIVRRAARELSGADGATFVLRDGDLCYYADEDAISPLWKGQRFPMSRCISGWVMLNRRHVAIEDIFSDPRVPADAYRPTFVKSLLMTPIRTAEPIGAIGCYWASRRRPPETVIRVLQSLADTVSVAMENVEVYSKLELRVRERTAEIESYTVKLEVLNRELQDFASAASHDMQEPLRKIISFGDQLRRKYGECLGEAGADYLSRMQTAASRMQTLLTALLQYSRVTTRAEPFVPVDLGCVVREVLDDLEVRISETGGIVERGELPTIEADPHQMRQLFQNLIGNALKYHGEKKPVVTIRGELVNGGEAWRIFVEDNGIGFDESYLERIFSPFQRLHSRAEFEGTGMGLAISRKIVERHRGGITAKSKPGEGAVFIATLPAVQRGE